MRPPACTQCRWGPGTTGTTGIQEKSSNSTASKELELKLKQMQNERTTQDIAWFAPPREEKKTSSVGAYGSNQTK